MSNEKPYPVEYPSNEECDLTRTGINPNPELDDAHERALANEALFILDCQCRAQKHFDNISQATGLPYDPKAVDKMARRLFTDGQAS